MSYAVPLQWMRQLASTQGGCRHCSHLQATEKHLLYWMRVRGCVCVCVCVFACKVCVCVSVKCVRVCVCQGSLICCVVLVKTHTYIHTAIHACFASARGAKFVSDSTLPRNPSGQPVRLRGPLDNPSHVNYILHAMR